MSSLSASYRWASVTRFPIKGKLPSNIPGVYFNFRLRIKYSTRDPELVVLRTAIRRDVHDRLAQISRKWSALEVDAAETALNAELQSGTAIEAQEMAVRGSVRLRTRRRSRRAADEYSAKLRDSQLHMESDVERLRFLRDEVFGSPGLAQLWWATEQPQQIVALGDGSFETLYESVVLGRQSLRRNSDLLIELRQIVDDPAQRAAAIRVLNLVSASTNGARPV